MVRKIPDYRQKQGILIYIRMVSKLLWYKLVLAASSVFFPFFSYIFYFMSISCILWVIIGGVKSILVKQIPDYRQKQGILIYIKMVPKLLWYKLVLATSWVFFPFFSYILFHFNFMNVRVNIGEGYIYYRYFCIIVFYIKIPCLRR